MDFWQRIDMSGECWIWTAGKNSFGYGVMWDGTRAQLAHRVSFAIHNWQTEIGVCVLHHCDNPACVRPSHLYAGTKADNARDRSARVRYRDDRGSRHPSAKLDESTVIAIRRALDGGAGLSDLGREHGVTPAAIYAIKNRRTWRHI